MEDSHRCKSCWNRLKGGEDTLCIWCMHGMGQDEYRRLMEDKYGRGVSDQRNHNTN